MRPRSLAEFVGQQHFLGEGKLLWRMLRAKRLGSVIFYGPPGTGKTTLARLLAEETDSRFRQLSAVTSGVKDVREVLEEARDEVAAGGRPTLLMIDEIHRFNRAQQDALLPDVEEGVVILVGLTTSNPFFAVNDALVSRSRVFEFQPLSVDEIKTIVRRALADKDRGLGQYEATIDDDALEFLAEVSDGDARRALGALEVAVLSADDPSRLRLSAATHRRRRPAQSHPLRPHRRRPLRRRQRAHQKHPRQRSGRRHLLARAHARRGRGRALPRPPAGDPGERRHRQRRSARAAAGRRRDAGLRIRRPARMPAHARPSGDVSGLRAEIERRHRRDRRSRHDIREGRLLPVPRHLQDSHYAGAKRLGHGEGYEYAHDAEGGIAAQDYLGVEREYYRPTDRGFEKELATRLEAIRARLRDPKVS